MTVHIPVLAGELVDLLDPAPGEIAVDCTFGGGGHARLIAERIGASGTLIGIGARRFCSPDRCACHAQDKNAQTGSVGEASRCSR